MGRTNDTVKILAAIQKNMDKKSWPCIYGGCDQHAINSHLLQRHGVLDRVVENGHLYEVKRCDYYKWNRNPPIEFKMVGLNRAISLPLFCHEHDSRLFRSIEQDEIDCSDYRMQLLLSYRTVCAEIRKKEMNIEFLGRMKNRVLYNFWKMLSICQLRGMNWVLEIWMDIKVCWSRSWKKYRTIFSSFVTDILW